MEDKLKLQSRTNERFHDQIVEEIQEIDQKKTEETLRMVQKKHDSWRYQIERGEARRLQSSGNSRRVRKGLDLQHPTSSEPCRPSVVDYDEEMALEPPRKRPEWEARGREKNAWRLEPEGETEVPETVIVDFNGEGHQGRGQVKTTEVKVACKEMRMKKFRVRRDKLFGLNPKRRSMKREKQRARIRKKWKN